MHTEAFMSEEAALIEAIRAAPNDDLARLVYADWLDEHGDSRGEFLRLQHQLATVLERIQHLQTSVERDWLNAVGIRRDLVLNRFEPNNRIALIKLIRLHTGKMLEETRSLVMGLLPAVIQSDLPLERALSAANLRGDGKRHD
jgi:uncharacterized protein (TIGR02996 family)